MHFKVTVSGKIYALIGLGFVGLLGVTWLDSRELDSSLVQQKNLELSHLGELALGIVKEEYAGFQHGSITEAEAQKRAVARVVAMRYGDDNYFFITDTAPRMISHPIKPELNGSDISNVKDADGKTFYAEMANVVRKDGSGYVGYNYPKPGFDQPQPKLSYVVGFAPWHWVIGNGVYINDLSAQRWASIEHALLAAGLVLLVTLVVSMLVARSITGPLRQITLTMGRLAQGDLSVETPEPARSDEIGDIMTALVVFKAAGLEVERMRAEQLDAERRQAQEKLEAVQDMAATVERETSAAVGEVSVSTERMAANATRMSDSAVLLAENSGSVVASAEQALANSRTLASAANQLSASIAEIVSQVTSSRTLTVDAVAASSRAQTTIAKLSEAAGKVGTVTSLISEIASQTNLLALNATIEAARAGEAGRGFAVVASEVKSLAEQTAKATSEIALQISEIQQATQESVDSISAIGEVIRNVESNASAIAASVERQSAVTLEISQTVEQSSSASREVASQIVSVSNEAVETGRRATEIRDGANEIAGKVDGLRTILVRVVRTSTSDADRRKSARTDIERRGTLEVGGVRHPVLIRNLSKGGALIDEVIAGALVNAPVVLGIDGYP
jgi:methyl-accepting chemotaxis protein